MLCQVRFKQSDTAGRVVSNEYNGPGIFTHQTCFPLHALLLAVDQPVVDALFLDVEGSEFEVNNSSDK